MIKTLIKKLINNDYTFAFISRITCLLLGLIYNVIFARYFGASLKGQSAIIINYASIMDTFMSLGIYHAYPFYRKDNADLYPQYLNNVISLYLLYQILAIGVFFVAPLAVEYKVACILFPILSGTRFVNYALLVENPKARNTAYLVQTMIEVVIVIGALVLIKPTALVMMIFIVLKEFITFIISILSLRYPIQKFRFTLSGIPTYIKYGYISMITGLLVTLNYKVDILMLDGKVPLEDIGVYSVGVSLAEKIWLIPDIIKNILISHLSKGKGDDEVAKVLRISTFITLICIVCVALFGKPFISIVFGNDYDGAYLITLILLFGIIGMVYQRIVYSYNIVNGKRAINVLYLTCAVIANVILNYILIPIWGITAAALSSVVSYTICGVLFILYFRKISRMPLKEIFLIQKDDINVIRRFIKK